jgi:hypothetical protein
MNVGLLYICAFAGMVIVLGSLLLLWKGRIVLDSVKGEISEVELPLGFKVKTQQPILVMFLFGSFLLAMPIYMIKERLSMIPRVAISGRVKNDPATVDRLKAYAIIDACDVTNEVKFYLPRLEGTPYRIKYYDTVEPPSFVYNEVVDLDEATGGTFQLPPFTVTNKPPKRECDGVAPTINLADKKVEDPSVVNIYK